MVLIINLHLNSFVENSNTSKSCLDKSCLCVVFIFLQLKMSFEYESFIKIKYMAPLMLLRTHNGSFTSEEVFHKCSLTDVYNLKPVKTWQTDSIFVNDKKGKQIQNKSKLSRINVQFQRQHPRSLSW